MFTMVEKRGVATAIILTIITCGIYGIYWFVKLNDEVNQLDGDTTASSGIVVFLLTLITCGIYGLYWLYKMGTKIDKMEQDAGAASQSRGIVYLILGIFGFSIVSYALMQDSINKMLDRGAL